LQKKGGEGTLSILTTADKFRYELEQSILEEIERLKETIALGFLEDYAQYKTNAGHIAGLRSALALLDVAERKCNGYSEEGKY
jgi:hypothetical protein